MQHTDMQQTGIRQTGRSETLVARTARALSRLSLEHEDGAFLGAEDDLLGRLGVSRPTLRQAAKIVENDRLLTVRRGIRGGFYASRPDAEDAIRTLARYLRLKGATLADIMVVSRRVSEEAATLACGSTDESLRLALARFTAGLDDADTPAALIAAEDEMARLVSRMSGNPAIELVMAIGFSFGMEEQGMGLYRDPEQRAQARKLLRGLCDAILDGDAEVARLMMRRRSDALADWIKDAMRGK
ncbi:FadR/GntR family transcriptional regulator [Sandaracinobacteroides sp. A072]|uniref:FadR/GntR family transcriptional regulator n=1 Tax=Sandaracinobacteroides sp. A072 TaxID=3461146 RepID=UPI004042A0B7